jgi:hypothetical protein
MVLSESSDAQGRPPGNGGNEETLGVTDCAPMRRRRTPQHKNRGRSGKSVKRCTLFGVSRSKTFRWSCRSRKGISQARDFYQRGLVGPGAKIGMVRASHCRPESCRLHLAPPMQHFLSPDNSGSIWTSFLFSFSFFSIHFSTINQPVLTFLTRHRSYCVPENSGFPCHVFLRETELEPSMAQVLVAGVPDILSFTTSSMCWRPL